MRTHLLRHNAHPSMTCTWIGFDAAREAPAFRIVPERAFWERHAASLDA